MKAKCLILTLVLALGVTVLAGCKKASSTVKSTDTVASPSQANDEATFVKTISKDGYYMVIVNKDLTFTEDLTVDGNTTKPGKTEYTRALAFAKTDASGAVVSRYTVKVPNLIINSENTLLEFGILDGNIYVQSAGFKVKDARITGNLYFATEDLMNNFVKDNDTVISGEILVQLYIK